MLVPAVLMVSTVRFRSFKSIDLAARRSYKVLLLPALVLVAVATHPRSTLAVLAYTYLCSAFVGMLVGRLRRRAAPAADDPQPHVQGPSDLLTPAAEKRPE